uniref:Uncharacterized protein n=1 Tax=viral metagenome TaxID=1070528 RepID=A0A6C0CQN4_9ZZZZ
MNLQKIKPCRPRPIYMNKNGGNMCFTLMSNVHVKNLEKQPHIKQVQTHIMSSPPHSLLKKQNEYYNYYIKNKTHFYVKNIKK